MHSYKEENQRLKTKFAELENAKADDVSDDLRREIILLKNRIEGLEKELKAQDLELKTANKMVKEKSNDQLVSVQLFSIKLGGVLNDISCFLFSFTAWPIQTVGE